MDIEELYQDVKEKIEQDVISNFTRDGYIEQVGFILTIKDGNVGLGIIPSPNNDKEELYAAMSMLAKTMHPFGAAMVSEAWMLQMTDIGPEEFEKMQKEGTLPMPSEHPDRVECVQINFLRFNPLGEVVKNESIVFNIDRSGKKPILVRQEMPKGAKMRSRLQDETDYSDKD